MSDSVASGIFFALWFGFFGLLALMAIAAVGLGIWTIVDVSQRPDWQFTMSGQNKVLWIVLAAVGIMVCQPLGVVANCIYLVSVRKTLDAVPVPSYGAMPYTPGPPAPWPPPPPSP